MDNSQPPLLLRSNTWTYLKRQSYIVIFYAVRWRGTARRTSSTRRIISAASEA
jgi:hypothetical protein